MSTILSRNGKVLTANNKALSHEAGDVNVQSNKSYTVSASGNQTISPDSGYDAIGAVSLTVPSGSATAPSTISSTGASVSTGTNTLTLTKSSVSVTPTVSAGYVSSGTAGTSSVSLTANVTTKGTTTYTPTTSNQTIASGTYLTGTQTIVGDSDLVAGNIKKDVTIFGVTGSYEGSGGGGGNIQTSKSYTVSSSGNDTIYPDTGYDGMAEVALTVPSGSATGPSSISASSASITPGTNAIVLTKTNVTTTPTVSAGYVSNATASTATVSLTATVPTKGVTTYYPSTSDQTISADTYLTGTQTIKGVTVSDNLIASNIKDGVTIEIGDSADSDRITSVTGTYTGASGYFTVTDTTDTAGGTIRTITPTEGTAVIQASKAVTINSNTTTTITPDTGNTALGQVVVTTDVSGGGGNPVAEEKDVIFIDYDGTIRYSYTAAEFAQLTELPANPTHDGLTAQGWNWTLSDAQSYVATYGRHCIGQNYTTTDGATRVYVDLTPSTLTPIIGLGVNGTVTIDWGDGSATETLTGTSVSSGVWSNQHTYSSAGSYCIKLTPASNSEFAFMGVSNVNLSSYFFRYSLSSSYLNVAYHNCIKRVFFGSSVQIREYSFAYCRSLEYVSFSTNMPSSNTYIGTYAFYYCNSLKGVVIPSGVTDLGNYLFSSAQAFAFVSLPKSLTAMGLNCFQYCQPLHFVACPPDMTSYNTYDFSNCYSLQSLVGKLPYRTSTSGSTLPNYLYEYCYCLYDLSKMIPSGVTNTGTYTFQYCYSITQLSFPSSLTTIGSNAFRYCHSLTSITIPSTVTSMGSYAFANCSGATTLSIGTGVTTIPQYCFQSCSSLTSVVIPNNITSFSSTGYQFRYCSSLTSVTFNNTMTSLPTYCFESCTSLTSFQFPTGCTTIGTYCFNNCNSLTTITIPSTVTSIGNNAFNTVSAMEEIHFTSTAPPTIGGSATFTNLPTTCKIYVPAGTLSAYTSQSNMPSSSTYTYIEE